MNVWVEIDMAIFLFWAADSSQSERRSLAHLVENSWSEFLVDRAGIRALALEYANCDFFGPKWLTIFLLVS